MEIRRARPDEFHDVEEFYRLAVYDGTLDPKDAFVVAECGLRLVGAYRLVREEGVLVLRGMRVLSEVQRRGVGSKLLEPLAFVRESCFCIPHRHLERFYGRAGFQTLPYADTPGFLGARAAQYTSKGLDVVVMLRPARSSRRGSVRDGLPHS